MFYGRMVCYNKHCSAQTLLLYINPFQLPGVVSTNPLTPKCQYKQYCDIPNWYLIHIGTLHVTDTGNCQLEFITTWWGVTDATSYTQVAKLCLYVEAEAV